MELGETALFFPNLEAASVRFNPRALGMAAITQAGGPRCPLFAVGNALRSSCGLACLRRFQLQQHANEGNNGGRLVAAV